MDKTKVELFNKAVGKGMKRATGYTESFVVFFAPATAVQHWVEAMLPRLTFGFLRTR